MAHDVFLSYSRQDTAVKQRVKAALEAEGLRVWTDERIEPSTRDWQDAIENAIEDADLFLVIFSPDAKNSRWVRAEMAYAEAQQKPMYYLLARGDESNAVPFGYTNVQWIDIRQDAEFETGLARLIEAICDYVGIKSRTQLEKERAAEEATRRQAEAKPLGNEEEQRQAAPKISVPQPAAQPRPTAKRLKAWNPLDWWRLLWWMFIAPAQLRNYRDVFGKGFEERIKTWLVVALAWLPWFIAVFDFVLEYPQAYPTWFLILSVVLPATSVLTSLLGHTRVSNWNALVIVTWISVSVSKWGLIFPFWSWFARADPLPLYDLVLLLVNTLPFILTLIAAVSLIKRRRGMMWILSGIGMGILWDYSHFDNYFHIAELLLLNLLSGLVYMIIWRKADIVEHLLDEMPATKRGKIMLKFLFAAIMLNYISVIGLYIFGGLKFFENL